MHWKKSCFISLINKTLRCPNYGIYTLFRNGRIGRFCWHNNTFLVKHFRGIEQMVYLFLHNITLSIPFLCIGHFFLNLNIEMWTCNIKTFLSAFIQIKILKGPSTDIIFCCFRLFWNNYQLLINVGSPYCSWVYSSVCNKKPNHLTRYI